MKYGSKEVKNRMKLHAICAMVVLASLAVCSISGATIMIEKRTGWSNTRGLPYEEPPVLIPVGTPLYWNYYVDNPGTEPIEQVSVTDDKEGEVNNLVEGDLNANNILDPGESWIFTLEGNAGEGYYENTAKVTGIDPSGQEMSSSAKSHYVGVNTEGAIDLHLRTNGEDADDPPGPEILVGREVLWTVSLTNNAKYDIEGIYSFTVGGEDISYDHYLSGDENNDGIINPGETWIYGITGIAIEGKQRITAEVQAWLPYTIWVAAGDSSYYTGRMGTPLNSQTYDKPDPVESGGFLTYTVEYSMFEYDPDEYGNMILFCKLSADDVTFISTTGGGIIEESGSSVEWYIEHLEPGEVGSVSCVGVVNAPPGSIIEADTVSIFRFEPLDPGVPPSTILSQDHDSTDVISRFEPLKRLEIIKVEIIRIPLPSDIEAGLLDKLNAASAALAHGAENPATRQLNAFINQVRAQKGKTITPVQANAFTTYAEDTIQGIIGEGISCIRIPFFFSRTVPFF